MLDFIRHGHRDDVRPGNGVTSGKNSPSFAEMCICPTQLTLPDGSSKRADGRVVLGLESPGPELEGHRRGDGKRVVLVRNTREGPRRVEVRLRSEVLKDGQVKL